MLQMRARGFALRDAFPDLLHGLITAEEAQDYPTPEPAREPVKVRPKFDDRNLATRVQQAEIGAAPDDPEVPDEPARATPEDMVKARHAVQQAKTKDRLDEIRARVEQRFIDDRFFTPSQADELFSLIDGKQELLTGQEVAS
jgi:hypothetical protein